MAERDPSSELAEKRADVASRDTPLVRNQWYVACMAEEVTRKPFRRTILEQDIVLYRKESGEAVALQNRCAHRSYPLHLGELNGDRIVCGYHGFEYSSDGRCALVPALGGARGAIRVQSYPVREIGPFVWIWTGDPNAVDDSKLVDQPWMTEAGWRAQVGYIYMEANYLGLKENVLDLTHFPFVHSFAKGQLHLLEQGASVEALPDRVLSTHSMANFPVQPVARKVMKFEGPVEEFVQSVSCTPAMEYSEVTHTDVSEPPKVATRYIIHCTTPESQTATHYHWAISRDYGLDDEELDQETIGIAAVAFKEDAVALEEIERVIKRDKRPGFREKIISTDSGGVQAMRLIARMAASEGNGDG